MKIILFIFTLWLLFTSLKPSSIKLNNNKDLANETFVKCNSSIDVFNMSVLLAMILSIGYCLFSALVIKTIPFVVITTFYLMWATYDGNMISEYINKKKEHWLLSSTFYRFTGKLFDIGYFGYVIYFLIGNW